MSTIVEKKCPRCGTLFNCKQEMGCWCGTLLVEPAMLAELRARFPDCLCANCLRTFAVQEK